MNEVLTVERLMEIGEERKRLLLRHLPPEELDRVINPEYKRILSERLLAEGREEGQVAAMCKVIERILQRRFGELLPEVHTKLAQLELEQLDALTDWALDAATLAEFLQQLPPPE